MGRHYRIRTARDADLAAIAALERRTFGDPWSIAAFRALLDDHAVVAAADGQVLGYLFARAMDDEAEIMNIAVSPAHRRTGVGSALLREATHRLRRSGVRTVYLEVRASNRAALTLYAAHGFAEVGRRAAYYREPVEDAIVMACPIVPNGGMHNSGPKRVSSVDKRT